MLFNIYINDTIDINNDAEFLLYANDTSLFVSGKNSAEIIVKAQSVLSDVLRWSTTNGLRINAKKMKAVFFRSRGMETNLHQSSTLEGNP